MISVSSSTLPRSELPMGTETNCQINSEEQGVKPSRAQIPTWLTLPLRTLGLFLITYGLCNTAAAEPDRVDQVTGAATWAMQRDGVRLSLTQLLPDQVRAFYVNRGFDLDDVEPFVNACVFMAVMRNVAAEGVIAFRQADWEIETQGESRAVPSLASWLDQWQAREVPAAAQLAFRWAQLPSEQQYAPGEWNQGMLAMGLPAGSHFDLIARWAQAGKPYEGRLSHVRCAD